MTSKAHARFVYWASGGGGFWDVNDNWLPLILPEGYALQPFDNDDVSIPAGGLPTVRFLEGINTLDVEPTAGITNNSVLGVHNGVVNDGFIKMSGDGQFGIDAGGLSGAGEVVLADSTGTYAAVTGAPFPYACCVTHAATHTIRGEGAVQGKWINNGLIRAEETSGDSTAELAITNSMTNNGVIRSSATAHIYAVSLDLTMGATGQFIADTQNIDLGVATITGGTINAINGAKFVRRSDAGGTTVFSGVTINGDFDVLVTNAGVAGIGTGITNNGTITLDNMGVANGQFHMDAGSTLDGTGTLVLNRQTDSVHVSGSFTHGASHTIRGAGRIHANIVNNGTIFAEPKTGGGLLRVVGNAITNNDLMQANDGATMRLEQGVAVTQGASGRIRAADGGRVELRDFATVNGGKLQTVGTGVIADISASVLNNVTNEGVFHVQTGVTTRVNTTLINNGTITVNPSGAAGGTGIEFSSDTLLSGTGTIVLNQTGNNAFISSAQSNQDITQAAGHTIRGGGRISSGYFGDGRFINNGRLEGNSAAQPLVIQAQLSGSGTLKDVQIGGDGFGISHTIGAAGTTAMVAAEGAYNFLGFNRMLFDLAGTTPGTGYDQLSSTGAITVSPTATRLEVSLAGGFLPKPGDTFTLIKTTDTLTGNFGAVVLPSLPLGLSWSQQQTANSLSISLTGSSLAADFDEDGDVDGDDLVRWKGGYGAGTLHTEGNADGDGDVDGADFLVWQRSLGWSVSTTGATTGVPEPGAAVLAIAALVVGSELSKNFRRNNSSMSRSKSKSKSRKTRDCGSASAGAAAAS